jgi:hypothetical protein
VYQQHNRSPLAKYLKNAQDARTINRISLAGASHAGTAAAHAVRGNYWENSLPHRPQRQQPASTARLKRAYF